MIGGCVGLYCPICGVPFWYAPNQCGPWCHDREFGYTCSKACRDRAGLTYARMILGRDTLQKGWVDAMEKMAAGKGKEHALEALVRRKDNPPKKIDNSSLYAGSPMHYYCRSCGHLAEVLPESHTERPKRLCDECQALEDQGWLTT